MAAFISRALLQVSRQTLIKKALTLPGAVSSGRLAETCYHSWSCNIFPMRVLQSKEACNGVNVAKYSSQITPNEFAAPNRKQNFSVSCIGKNLKLYTSQTTEVEVSPRTLKLNKPTGNPLVIIMAWLMAKQKHLQKYIEIYINMGFDVMIVQVTPWQLLWPTKGTQVVASETLNFLSANESYSPMVVHGFSVGAYQMGEIMVQMSEDLPRFQKVIDRFACQIWDSAADITEIPQGVPKAIFPNNKSMRNALRNYTLYHLKAFHNQATVHYIRASEMFHATLIKQPALVFFAANDPIGPPSSNMVLLNNWERAGVKCTSKCWERSTHAAHFMRHPVEYLKLLQTHLEQCGVFNSDFNSKIASQST